MMINADFTKSAVVHAGSMPWISSPLPGVERIMLDRVGDEVARATSLVRYAPRSRFSRHVHGGGEEFLVLEGVFQDEHGDYPAGSYVRNPPGTSHAPWSDIGCVIFVKLWQFDPNDHHSVALRSPERAALSSAPRVIPLFRAGREEVQIELWDAGAPLEHLGAERGLELFVLEGSFEQSGVSFAKHSWLRLPAGASLDAQAGTQGVKVWAKYTHSNQPLAAAKPGS
jgi:hypothetical protein